MKRSRIILIVACLSIVCSLFSCVCSALEQDEMTVLVTWTNQTPFQGSSTTVSIFLKSTSAETLTIYYIGINFDWMDSDKFIGRNLSDAPVTIPSYGSHTFYSMIISVPENASIGTHNYFVGIDGEEGDSDSFSWDSQTLLLVVRDAKEEEYTELLTEVSNNITDAVDANYQSSEAKALLGQAEGAYDDAVALAAAENWEDAVSTLQNASSYLEQAAAEEQNYVETQGEQNDLLVIVGIAAVAVVAILVIILVFRKTNKKTASANQPTAA